MLELRLRLMLELVRGDQTLKTPKTVTCNVLSSEALKALRHISQLNDKFKQSNSAELHLDKSINEELTMEAEEGPLSHSYPVLESSFVLAGLHACGDLSVTMLRTFLECEEVKAVVSVGCCYNLLSEKGSMECFQCGFPISNGLKLDGFSLGKIASDLACQSAERWRSLTKSAAQENFQQHAFRAIFQKFLCRTYPEVSNANPKFGHQGKALRRQQLKKVIHTQHLIEENTNSSLATTTEIHKTEKRYDSTAYVGDQPVYNSAGELILKDGLPCSDQGRAAPSQPIHTNFSSNSEDTQLMYRYSLFEKFCVSGLRCLGLEPPLNAEFLEFWMEAAPLLKCVGPYWALTAALGPLIETLLLLDRLLFLQEGGNSVKAFILPLFNPMLSPRNVALIASKV